MPFELTRDKALFKTFWLDELNNSPRHFNDASHTWRTSWEEFQSFCAECERIYCINGVALLYAERNGRKCNLHFSILRGTDVDMGALLAICDELLKDYVMLFAWIGSHNRGLQRMAEQCGLKFVGLEMRKGQSHGKVFVWRCYATHRQLV